MAPHPSPFAELDAHAVSPWNRPQRNPVSPTAPSSNGWQQATSPTQEREAAHAFVAVTSRAAGPPPKVRSLESPTSLLGSWRAPEAGCRPRGRCITICTWADTLKALTWMRWIS